VRFDRSPIGPLASQPPMPLTPVIVGDTQQAIDGLVPPGELLEGPQRVPREDYFRSGEIERLPPVVDRLIIWPYPPPQPEIVVEESPPSLRERLAQMRHCLWLSATAGLWHAPEGIDPALLLPDPTYPWSFRAE